MLADDANDMPVDPMLMGAGGGDPMMMGAGMPALPEPEMPMGMGMGMGVPDPMSDPESAIGMLLMRLSQGWQEDEEEAGMLVAKAESNKQSVLDALMAAIEAQDAPDPMMGFAEGGPMMMGDPMMDAMPEGF